MTVKKQEAKELEIVNHFNVEVIKDFTDSRKIFLKGEVYKVCGDSVIINNLWICDIPSPRFEQYFKIVKEIVS